MPQTRPRINSSGNSEFIIILTGVPDLPLCHNNGENWRPVKDVMRLILLKEPGRVECELPNIHVARDNQRRRTATCTFRVKKAADKIFKCLAGKTWFGSCLLVQLSEHVAGQYPRPIEVANICDLSQLAEEEFPIKEDHYIQRFPRPTVSGTVQVPRGLDDNHLAQRLVLPLPSLPLGCLGPSYYSPYLQFHPPMIIPSYGTYESPGPSQYSSNSPESCYNTGFLPIPQLSLYSPPAPNVGLSPNPIYHINNNGIPVNTSHGLVAVQPSTIFVKNFPPRVTRSDIENLFTASGEVIRCELSPHAQHPRTKSRTARVWLKSHEEAVAAVRRFDKRQVMGKTIEVKLDHGTLQEEFPTREVSLVKEETENVDARENGPIIIDGSGGDVV